MRFYIFAVFTMALCSTAFSQYEGYYSNRGIYLNYGAIRQRWEIQDAYKERNEPENFIDKKNRLYDMAEIRYELEKRERKLISEGILPKPDENAGTFIVRGERFSSIEQFDDSDVFRQIKEENRLKEIERRNDEQRKIYENQRYGEFMRMWRSMGPTSREKYNQLSQADKELRITQSTNSNSREDYLENEASKNFYQKHPHLIYNAGEGGLPPAPKFKD